jgi:MFS family permease
MATVIPTAGTNKISSAARSSIIGGVISLLIDSYDIYVPAFILAGAMDYFEPSSMPDSMKVTIETLIFTVTLLARPIGGPILGNLSDKIGRKRTTMIAAIGFTITTFLIGFVPGYAQWGYGSIAVLIFLRLIDGIFLGGGYAGPVPLAIERSPAHLRGLIGGLIAAGAPVAILFINVVQLLVLKKLPHEAYLSWGWRLPFFFGAFLGILYLIYYSRVPELEVSKLRRDNTSVRQPIWELFSGPNFKSLIQVMLLLTGMWFAVQMVLSFLPGLLIGILHQSPANVSTLELTSSAATAVGMILYAVLSQRIGRRSLLIAVGLSIIIGESLAYFFMVRLANGGSGFLAIGIMAFIAIVLANSPLGAVIVYLNERFPSYVRGSGYGTSYTISLIIPGLYSLWLYWLGKIIPYEYTGLILIVLGGVLFLWASVLGPETRDTVLLPEEEHSLD